MKIEAHFYISTPGYRSRTYTREFDNETDLNDRLTAWAENNLVLIRDNNGLLTAAFPWGVVSFIEVTRTEEEEPVAAAVVDPFAYRGGL